MPVSDVFLTAEELAFRDRYRKFLQEEIVPLKIVERMDSEATEYPTEFIRRCGEAGYLGLAIAREWGGQGLDTVHEVLASEETGVLSTGLVCARGMPTYMGKALERYGTPEQKEKYLVPIMKGEKIVAEALTEPVAGSDLAGIKTKAVRDGDHYVITGEKRFQAGGIGADFFLVLAVTDPAARHKGLSFFIVERDMGVTVEEKYQLLGFRGMGASRLGLKEVRVPRANLLGEEGQGWEIFNYLIRTERLCEAAGNIGAGREALRIAAEYSDTRKAFGRKLRDFQAISFRLAEMVTAVDAGRLLLLRAARKMDRGEWAMKEVAQAKFFASEAGYKAVDFALQVLGGIGYTNQYPLERFLRDTRVVLIYTGSSEIQRLLAAREIYNELLRETGRG